MSERLFWCDIGYATFGIITENDVVIRVAPIAKWMLGKTLSQIKPWLISKQAKVIEV